MAAVLMVGGAAGTLTAAWLWHLLFGLGLTCAAVFALGVALGME